MAGMEYCATKGFAVVAILAGAGELILLPTPQANIAEIGRMNARRRNNRNGTLLMGFGPQSSFDLGIFRSESVVEYTSIS
jgi:hypothetical protein